jgi:hypothetical protein
MKKKITFIGNPNGNDGRPWVEVGGKQLRVGHPEVLDLAPELVRKLEGNSHFQVEDVNEAAAPAAPVTPVRRSAPAPEAPEAPEPPEAAEVSVPASEESTISDDAPISVRRARPRSK